MAQILTEYDLSLGETFSTVIDVPANINLAWKSDSVTDSDQVVELEWLVQVEDEDFHLIRSDKRTDIISKLRGNESDNTNVFGINATKLKIKIIPPAGADGNISLWALNN